VDGQEQQQGADGVGGSAECLMCPVCALLQAVTSVRPDVTQHLLAAAREVALAFKAAVDAHADGLAHATVEEDRALRRIRLE
jgi:hypothetical protein